jgi:hypothetical protein
MDKKDSAGVGVGVGAAAAAAAPRASIKSMDPATDGRVKREQSTVHLRKQKREECMQRKRHASAIGEANKPIVQQSAPKKSGDEKHRPFSKDDHGADGDDDDDGWDGDGWDEDGTLAKAPTVLLQPNASHMVNLEKCRLIQQKTQKSLNDYPTLVTASEEYLLHLPVIGEGLNGNDRKIQLESVRKLRRMLSIQHMAPLQEVIECGFVPRLLFVIYTCIMELRSPSPRPDTAELHFEGIWACTNIASGSPKQTRHLIECNGLPVLFESLKTNRENIWCQSIWTLGNIAGDSRILRDMILTEEKHESSPLFLVLHGTWAAKTVESLRTVGWFLSNLCRNKPKWDLIKPAIPVLAHLLEHPDIEVQSEACWSLAHLADTDNDVERQTIVHAQVLPKIVETLRTKDPNIRLPALRTIANLARSDDEALTQAILNSGVLSIMLDCISDVRAAVRKESCFALSNLCGGPPQQIQQIIDAKLISPLILLVKSSSTDFETRREATWCLANTTNKATPQQIAYMVSQGLLFAVCEQLKSPDPTVTILVLEAVEAALASAQKYVNVLSNYKHEIEECGGLELIEKLVETENESIYDKSRKIVNTYFKDEDELDDDYANDTKLPTNPFTNQFTNTNGAVAGAGVGVGPGVGPGTFQLPPPSAPPHPHNFPPSSFSFNT